MKQLLILLGCAVLLLAFSGCQESGRSNSGAKVIVEGGGKFPSFLVGRWKDKKKGWEFVFEPDGTISFVLMGPFDKELRPGQITIANMPGAKGVYEPGDWTVRYSPASRELTVTISLKNFYLELGDNELIEGDCMDMFVGSVWPNGDVWQTEWTSFPQYIVREPQSSSYVRLDLRDHGTTINLTFEKIAPK